jgi:cardiolipin synthase A/B
LRNGAQTATHRDRPKAVASRRTITLAAGVVLAAGALILALSIFHRVLDITRGTPVRAMLDANGGVPAVADARFADVAAAVSATTLRGGNDLRLFFTGEPFYAQLFEDLRSAQRSISFQPYYCGRGTVADSVVAILRRRAESGVTVRFVADGFGCAAFASHYAPTLRSSGVNVAVLRPLRWYTLHRAQHRSHARVVVIDGRVAYTGGFGADDKWLFADGSGWRDTNVRFAGSAVAAAQAAFLAAWAEATGELVADSSVFPLHDADTGGPVLAGVQHAGPGLGTTPFERMLLLSIHGARQRLYISSAYFVPGSAVRAALAGAAGRGVDVRILTAGARTDVPSTRLAGRATYGELLRAGVRIFEYEPTMMHAKTLVADGMWAVVGGMNIDNRSLRLNDEVNLLAWDAATATELEHAFSADLLRAREVTAIDHEARALREQLLERALRLVAPLL